MEVCRALKLSRDAASSLVLSPTSVDINCLGVARVSVLLEQIPPQVRSCTLFSDLNAGMVTQCTSFSDLNAGIVTQCTSFSDLNAGMVTQCISFSDLNAGMVTKCTSFSDLNASTVTKCTSAISTQVWSHSVLHSAISPTGTTTKFGKIIFPMIFL